MARSRRSRSMSMAFKSRDSTHDVVIIASGGNSIYAFDANSGGTALDPELRSADTEYLGAPGRLRHRSAAGNRPCRRPHLIPSRPTGISVPSRCSMGPMSSVALPLVANPLTNKVWGGLNRVGNSIYVASASNGGDVAPWRGQVYQIDVSGLPTLVRNFEGRAVHCRTRGWRWYLGIRRRVRGISRAETFLRPPLLIRRLTAAAMRARRSTQIALSPSIHS